MTLWIVIREAKLGRCEQGLLLPDRKLEDGPEAQRKLLMSHIKAQRQRSLDTTLYQ